MMDNGQPSRRRIPKSTLETAVLAGKFNGIGCMVDHRNLWSTPQVEKLAGQWGEVTWEESTGKVVGVLSLFDTPAGQLTGALFDAILQEETPTNVGISLDCYGVWEWDEASEFVILTEITHVSSADTVFGPATESRVRTALSALSSSSLEDNDMPKWLRILLDAKAAGGAPPAPTQPNFQAQAAEAVHLEAQQADVAQRLAEVQKMAQASFAAAAAGLVNASKLPEFEKETLIKSLAQFSTVAQVETAINERLAIAAKYAEETAIKMGSGAPRGGAISGMQVPLDDARNIMNWMFGVEGAKLPEPEYRNFRMFYGAMTGDYAVEGRVDPSNIKFAGATTSDLPNMAVDAMNKIIVNMWKNLQEYRWWENITSVVPNDGSLHAIKLIMYDGPNTLATVAEKGTYAEVTPADTKETATWNKKGNWIGITREMIKNSDIMAIRAVPEGLAQAALRTRSAAVSAYFTQASGVGPNLADGNPLFHSSGGNVATTALDKAGWLAARSASYAQTTPAGAVFGVRPKYCLVPEELFDATLEIFGYGEGQPTSYNILAEDRGLTDPRPTVLSVPEWTDVNNWAWVVNPVLWKTICISYSVNPAGTTHALPELFTMQGDVGYTMFFNDQIAIKVRDEFALGVTGRTGIGKRNVA